MFIALTSPLLLLLKAHRRQPFFSPPPSFYIYFFFMSLSAGNEPQTEKQVEKVSTLSLVRRDTALLLRDFRQGASNWIQSLLDPNRASAFSSTAAEAPPGASDTPTTGVYNCVNTYLIRLEGQKYGWFESMIVGSYYI